MDKEETPTKKIPTKKVLSSEAPTIVESEDLKSSSKTMPFVIIGAVAIIAIGVAIGYVLANRPMGATLSAVTGGKIVQSKKVIGSLDEKEFPDTTEGQLEKGGINGEGTHKLIREGGPSQTAYLTSSVIDLDQFVGKKVKVWGKTFAAQKAGWLMDVGRLEILE